MTLDVCVSHTVFLVKAIFFSFFLFMKVNNLILYLSGGRGAR